ncbi:hypothetical protein L0222_27280, partial [bacterium]|nr:hypothetical protein [bacterium]
APSLQARRPRYNSQNLHLHNIGPIQHAILKKHQSLTTTFLNRTKIRRNDADVDLQKQPAAARVHIP